MTLKDLYYYVVHCEFLQLISHRTIACHIYMIDHKSENFDQPGFLMPTLSVYDAQERSRGMPYLKTPRAALPFAAKPCLRSAWICSSMSSLITMQTLAYATAWSLRTQQLKLGEHIDRCGGKFRSLTASSRCGTVPEAYHLAWKHQLCDSPPLCHRYARDCYGNEQELAECLANHVLRRLNRWSSSASESSVPLAACSMPNARCKGTVM